MRDCRPTAEILSAALLSVLSKWSMRSKRRCGSSTSTNAHRVRSSTFRPAPASDMASARRPAACCITDTGSTTEGLVSAATIIPPTSQNQAAIEADLAHVVSDNLSLDDAALTTLCEK